MLFGALAMSTAARPARGPFGLAAEQTLRLGTVVLNDIGPSLSFTGLTRIAEYVGQAMQFATFEPAVDYVSSVSAGFGPHDRQGWENGTAPVRTPAPQAQLVTRTRIEKQQHTTNF